MKRKIKRDMQVAETIADVRRIRAGFDQSVGLVPTMGALHAGHLALVKAACADNDAVIATIFVNPTQFGPNEDLSNYPRDLQRDLDSLEAAGVDLVFTPTPDVMYPTDHVTAVEVREITDGQEGAHRPGHFRGVATVVAKLFNITQPTTAYFGQKDAQQVVVIRRMVRDLDFPLDIAVCPTVREADGLALSSRNRYLNAEERAAAPVIYRALQAAGERYEAGERDPAALRDLIQAMIDAEALATADYISVADPVSMAELQEATNHPMLLSLTVRVGPARLLDNSLLPLSLNTRTGLDDTLGNPHARHL